jgi:hypothetical protein
MHLACNQCLEILALKINSMGFAVSTTFTNSL